MAEQEYVTIPQLPDLILQITTLLEGSNADGKSGKFDAADLATLLAPYVASVGASGYVVTPANILAEFPARPSLYTFVGEGTFTQTNVVDIVTTDPLNLLSWNGTVWSKTVGIPVDVDNVYKMNEDISRYQFVKGNNGTIVDIAETTAGLLGYIKLAGQLLVYNQYGGFYRLNSFKQTFGGGKEVFYLSASSSSYVPLNNIAGGDFGECFVLSSVQTMLRDNEKVVIGATWASGFGWSSIYNVFQPTKKNFDFYIAPGSSSDISLSYGSDKSVTVNVLNNVPVFFKQTGKVFFLKAGNYVIPEGRYIMFAWQNGTDLTFSFNKEVPNVTQVTLFPVAYGSYDEINYSSILGINWNGTIYSEQSVFNKQQAVTAVEVLDFSRNVPVLAIKEELRPFFEQLDALTDADEPLEILAIGDSILNFQETGSVKANRTVEPQGLYGDTFLRWIWRRLNFTFDSNDQDNVAVPFSTMKDSEWGNMRFMRVDHPDAVKSSEFIPSGTRTDGNMIYWSQRQDINGLRTCLGGHRIPTPDAGNIVTSIGTVNLHNHVYFFNNGGDAYVEYTIPGSAKGFSMVFWGDTFNAPFPRLAGGSWEYLSYDVEVKVDNVIVGHIDQTTFNGQSRVNFTLTETGSVFKIRFTNKSTGRTMNLWGLEFWIGKCVRMSNCAAAGNGAQAFSNNPAYAVNHPADLVIWQTTTLNNPTGLPAANDHIALGNLIKAKNVPIAGSVCHPIVEGIGNNTNYPDVAKADITKHFQHVDAYGAEKAMYKLGIPFVDAFNAFIQIAAPLGYTGDYNSYFIDGTHLSVKGENVYKDLFNYVYSYHKSIK